MRMVYAIQENLKDITVGKAVGTGNFARKAHLEPPTSNKTINSI